MLPLRQENRMFKFDSEFIERVAAAIEDDLKPVTTVVVEVDIEDFDMEW